MDVETLRVAKLERLLALHKRIASEDDVGRILDVTLESVIEFTNAARGFVLVRDPDGQVRVRAAKNLDRDTVKSDRFRPSRAIADRVLLDGEPILSVNVSNDERFDASESLHEMSVKSVLAIPIRSRESVVGAIYLDREASARTGFDADDLRLLQDFGDVAATAVEMRRLVQKLEQQGEELGLAKAQLEVQAASLREDVAAKSVEIARAERNLDSQTRALGLKFTFRNIVGRSPQMHRLLDLLQQIMDYPVPVLISGESGTGKELVARALHHGGPRARSPFMAINCAAIPENLLESELFGYKKGAFTGSTNDKEGLFRAARGGTVFLDEIGEMPLSIQSKILRVLQEKEVRPIGGRESEKIDARIVAATNRDLPREIAAGRFREDLFYRLNVVDVHMPPLRERIEDIPALVEHFLAQVSLEFGVPPRTMSPDAMELLLRFPWPGNVRQLENTIKASSILARGPQIQGSEVRLPKEEVGPAPIRSTPKSLRIVPQVAAPPLPEIRNRSDWEASAKQQLLDALIVSGWKKSKAAELLGISRRNLYRKLERYGIEGGQ
ncbi:MAG: sigma-54-dependent Fis family transcriptional regulator [Myxococcales bacterium]|nr:sigma-54-dependent Fis family transcriptional regulator [Myxococcales bacterium]